MRIADLPSPFRGEGLGEGKGNPLEEILLRLTLNEIPSAPKKILFRGEGVGGIASYTAGWMAGQGMDVIVLDGANRFDPYAVSSYARRASISPEEILKRIRVARAFTCYQMATLMGEKLFSVLGAIREMPLRRIRVIVLGPLATFLDEDVPEREIRPLFERSLKKMEDLTLKGVSLFLFQPSVPSDSRRAYLPKRLTQFSDLVWRIHWDDRETKMVLEKGFLRHSGRRGLDLPMVNPKFQIKNLK